MLQCDVCGVVGLVGNKKRICLFDMSNHNIVYIVCPDSEKTVMYRLVGERE